MTATSWTRRRVLQGMAVAAAARPVAMMAGPLTQAAGNRLYACMAGSGGSATAVRVFDETLTGWALQQHIPAAGAMALVADAASERLYVAHARPNNSRGYVQAYRMDRHTGSLSPRGQQSLALSAIQPVAMALSPGGALMVVASASHVFSVLPVSADGVPGEVTAAHKELLSSLQGAAVTRMRFVDENRLHVEDSHGARAYWCTADGMQPMGPVASFEPVPRSPIAGANAFVLVPHS